MTVSVAVSSVPGDALGVNVTVIGQDVRAASVVEQPVTA